MQLDGTTTIAVSVKNRDRLAKLKIHPAQPLDEVVEKLLDNAEVKKK